MIYSFWVLIFLLLPSMGLSMDLEGKWVLSKSELTYEVTHPLHHAFGKSVQARGKGIVDKGKSEFIVGVPVKSFESGDGNRDTHMLQITKGADYPLIVVNISFKTPFEKDQALADLSIQFAGKTLKYPQISLKMVPLASSQVQVTTLIHLSLKDLGITPPSLLGVPINDSVPIQVDTTWQKVTSFDVK